MLKSKFEAFYYLNIGILNCQLKTQEYVHKIKHLCSGKMNSKKIIVNIIEIILQKNKYSNFLHKASYLNWFCICL